MTNAIRRRPDERAPDQANQTTTRPTTRPSKSDQANQTTTRPTTRPSKSDQANQTTTRPTTRPSKSDQANQTTTRPTTRPSKSDDHQTNDQTKQIRRPPDQRPPDQRPPDQYKHIQGQDHHHTSGSFRLRRKPPGQRHFRGGSNAAAPEYSNRSARDRADPTVCVLVRRAYSTNPAWTRLLATARVGSTRAMASRRVCSRPRGPLRGVPAHLVACCPSGAPTRLLATARTVT